MHRLSRPALAARRVMVAWSPVRQASGLAGWTVRSERAGSGGEPSGLPREEGGRGAGTVRLTRLPEAREAKSNCLFVCPFGGIGATA
jgi:hypothetical protein